MTEEVKSRLRGIFLSRKFIFAFIPWIVATVFLCIEKITGSDWMIITGSLTMIYTVANQVQKKIKGE